MKIYYNGHIFDETYTIQEAFVENGGNFIFVGSNQEALSYAGEKIDLQGQYVLPGFNDSHMHLVGYGQSLKNIQLAKDSTSLQEVLDQIAKHVKNNTENQWVIGRGWNQDYFEDEKRFPTRQDLDDISSTVPIYITRACGHVLVANSKAIDLANIQEQEIPGGSFDITTGVFKENALSLIYNAVPKPTMKQIQEYIVLAQAKLHSYGITSVQSDDLLSVSDSYQDVLDAYKQLQQEQKLTIRVYQQAQLQNIEVLKEFIAKGYHTGVGDPYFKIGPLKMLGDGSLGARTAFLSQSYYDDPTTKGIPVYTKKQMLEMFTYAHTHGMQIAIHAIGDGILDWVLATYQKVLKKYPRKDHRHGVVHCQITRKEQLDKFKELQLHGYIQSIFLDYDIRIIHQRIHPEIVKTSYHFKTLQEQTTISNGSDAPVESPDVFKGIQLSITRTPVNETIPYLKEQALSLVNALDSYTKDGAYASFEEHLKGSIKQGMVADFIITDTNIFTVQPNKIKDIQVVKTYVGGRLVYTRGENND